ncbi:myozenin-2-like isoform X2 [Myxocyprinus asiaticus]|uniref:myozenin-2-like isoform X2 n=1 Tax=Myxocyprinus asiaticus TaxID=70543 RepID=UPI002222A9FF|nr:myozenin-2-like isoform X2 [Myxocyprinus asiaticus]
MQTAYDSLTKQRQQQAMSLSREAKGGSLNLGKKISAPKDLMMEELNLNTNRGSRMFQERQRRVERYTLENTVDAPSIIYNNKEQNQNQNQNHMITDIQRGEENLMYPAAGKQSLVTTLKKTVAKKGSPNVLAPGYSGPLREIPREKFNSTVIPKSYCSPWQEALGDSEELLPSLNAQLPQLPQKLPPANYRCFNRAAVPFGGHVCSQRVISVIGFEQLETQNLPDMTLAMMSKRPNFNRAPQGWGARYSPESNDL